MFSTRSGRCTLSKNIRLAYDDELLARMASAARQLVELPEHLLLQVEPLGDRLDDKPRVVHCLGEVSLGRNPAWHDTSEAVRQFGKALLT